MFANNNASRSSTSLTIDEIRWLNASKLEAFSSSDEGDSVRSVPFTDLAKSHSVAIPKNSRPRYNDSRRRSILLDDFLGSNTLNRSVDSSRFGFASPSSPRNSPPPSPDKILPVTPSRAASYSTAHLDQPTALQEMPRLPQRSTEWLYRRPRSPSTLSRSPSSLSSSPSSISRSPSSSRSVTPTPSRIRPPTGYRPRTPVPAVAEMNQSPFWSTVVPPQRTASVRTGSPSSHGNRTPSRSSPNLLEFRASPRSKYLARPPALSVQRERSGSESSSISTTSTSSLPRTPPSPSIYSQHSFTYPHPDTRSTTPTKSILTLAPKRSPSISTKHSSKSVKSVKFDEVPAIRYAGDREFHIGDGKVRGEEWNSHVLEGGAVGCMGFDMDSMDLLDRGGAQAQTKNQSGALKRFLTLRTRNKSKPRPEISGPYALAPSSPGLPPQSPEHAGSQLSLGSPSSSPFKSKSASASFLVHENVGVIPSSPNGGTDTGASPKHWPKKSSSLIGPGDIGVLPDHGRFLSTKFYSHPVRSKSAKSASLTGSGSVGLIRSEPVLHTLPSMESFRSVRSTKSTRNCGRFRDWLGRIGIGVVA